MSHVGKAPTVADEMAKFTGFSTNNGITVSADKTKTGPGEIDLADDERAAGIKIAGKEARGAEKTSANIPAKVELTDDEAEAALAAAREKLGEGEELTREEEDEVLSTALGEKRSKATPKGPTTSDRVRRAQEGRRRAEARAATSDRELSALKERLAKLEAGGTSPLTASKKEVKSESKEPDPKDFELGELDPKYVRALVRWENAQIESERTKNQETRQRSSTDEEAAAKFAEKRAALDDAGLDAYDDFQEVVLDTADLPKSDPANWPCSPTLASLIFDSEVGHHVAYALASDPKEARKIDKLTPAAQARWFFKQEAKFEAEQAESGQAGEGKPGKEDATARRETVAPQPRQVSKAPPPPERNRGGSGNRQVSAATTDFAAFEAMAAASAKPKR